MRGEREGRRETGDGRQETGDGRQGTGEGIGEKDETTSHRNTYGENSGIYIVSTVSPMAPSDCSVCVAPSEVGRVQGRRRV